MSGNIIWDFIKTLIFDPISDQKIVTVLLFLIFIFALFGYKVFVYFFQRRNDFKVEYKKEISDLEGQIDAMGLKNEASLKELSEKIGKIYKLISTLRVTYACEMATTDEVQELTKTIHNMEVELSKIKGYLGIN